MTATYREVTRSRCRFGGPDRTAEGWCRRAEPLEDLEAPLAGSQPVGVGGAPELGLAP